MITVYVDRLRPCIRNRNWRWPKACHLFVFPEPGAVDVLHAAARRIGLNRAWFQGDGTMPHYDLTAYKRLKALQDGAVEADDFTLVDALHAWRAWKGTTRKRSRNTGQRRQRETA